MSQPSALSFHLRCAPACPVAQRAMVALEERGTSFDVDYAPETAVVPQQGGLRSPGLPMLTLFRTGEPPQRVADGLAMIELIEDMHTDQPLHPADAGLRAAHRAMMAWGQTIQSSLSIVTRITDPGDLDMAVHMLHARLLRAEQQLQHLSGGHAFSNVGVVFGPTLWRLRVLDARCGTFLLAGLPRLKAWATELMDRPSLRKILSEREERVYLDTLARRGAVLVSPTHNQAWADFAIHSAEVRGAGDWASSRTILRSIQSSPHPRPFHGTSAFSAVRIRISMP